MYQFTRAGKAKCREPRGYTIEMEYFTVLEAGSLRSRCRQGHAPPESAKGESSRSFRKHQTACGVSPCACSVLSRGWLRSHGPEHAGLLCPLLSPGVCSKSCPLSQWCCLTTSSSDAPFSFSLPQHQGLFQWVSSSHKVAKVLSAQWPLIIRTPASHTGPAAGGPHLN